jgi:putative endonuclease
MADAHPFALRRPRLFSGRLEGRLPGTAVPAKRILMSFWVYLLRCADGSYYVGHTDDLEKRIAEHQRGDMAGYTATWRPVQLVHAESFTTREEALGAERQLKGWSRKKKEAWARGDWAEVSRLGERRTSTRRPPPGG